MVFSGCGSKTEKIADAEKKNPDTIILLDEGKEISMAILDTKGKTIKEFEDISYADAISEGICSRDRNAPIRYNTYMKPGG